MTVLTPDSVRIGSDPASAVPLGGGAPLAVICGPCVIESPDHVMRMADAIGEITAAVGLRLIFKSSYDKANRTSATSFRGVGPKQGGEILAAVRERFGVPVVTDVHSPEEAKLLSTSVDLLQIPAFLCRQTPLIEAAADTGLPLLIKKGQFVAPEDMRFAAEKSAARGNNRVILCERGACFGYRDLVVDFRGLAIMRDLGRPVVFDATHSVQVMGGGGGVSTGRREFVPLLARAAVAAGVDGIFIECHDDPDRAPSDGPNMVPLSALRPLLADLKALSELTLATRPNIRSVNVR